MIASEHTILEWLRGPVIAVDRQTRVSVMARLSDDISVHYFAIQERGRTVARACSCDIRSAAPNAPISNHARSLHMTLSPDTSVDAALGVLNAELDWIIVEGSDSTLLGIVTWHDLQETLDGFDKVHAYYCNGCGADHCLKKFRQHVLLCPECLDRTMRDGWYDLGVAG